jgi:hypothetical protein
MREFVFSHTEILDAAFIIAILFFVKKLNNRRLRRLLAYRTLYSSSVRDERRDLLILRNQLKVKGELLALSQIGALEIPNRRLGLISEKLLKEKRKDLKLKLPGLRVRHDVDDSRVLDSKSLCCSALSNRLTDEGAADGVEECYDVGWCTHIR